MMLLILSKGQSKWYFQNLCQIPFSMLQLYLYNIPLNSWKTFFETCHALFFSMITLPFKSVSGDVRILISLHWIQVRSEVINVYFDETEELSSKTYLFHLSPTIVFHNLLNIPVTFLLEVCYILFIKYSNHYIKTNITALISGML